MKAEIKLSIIVPVYNMEADGKLAYCMDSLLDQKFENGIRYEIIAVDDASTDDSVKILRAYEERFPQKVRVLCRTENGRQGSAKNMGMKEASGEWIGFVDSDDWVAPDMYPKLLARAKETGADVVGCDYTLVQKHTFEVGSIVQNNTKEQTGVLTMEQRKSLWLTPGSMVIKIYQRNMILTHDLWFPERMFYEDNCASPLWMYYAKHFEKVEEPLYYYYQHETSTVHTVSEERCKDRLKALVLLEEECESRGIAAELEVERAYRFAELYGKNTLFSYVQGAKKVRLGFLNEIRKGLLKHYPMFLNNTYLKERTNPEEQRLLRYFMKSPVFFLIYYRALRIYRKIWYNS